MDIAVLTRQIINMRDLAISGIQTTNMDFSLKMIIPLIIFHFHDFYDFGNMKDNFNISEHVLY